jgi:hypothetical protein
MRTAWVSKEGFGMAYPWEALCFEKGFGMAHPWILDTMTLTECESNDEQLDFFGVCSFVLRGLDGSFSCP